MRAKIIFLLWRSWHHRNNIVHGDGKASVVASASFIANYLESFSSVNSARPDPKGKVSVRSDHKLPEGSARTSNWTAPNEGQLKANVDAGWDALTKRAGIGVIVRDHMGQVIVSEWKFIPSCTSAEEAEVLACLEGFKHLINLRRWPAILESDCLRAVQNISSQDQNRSECWSLYCQARELLRVYQSIEIRKVERVSNGAAHVVAQLGKSGVSGFLCNATPACASTLVANDCKMIVPN
jgi:ribonuclease HI